MALIIGFSPQPADSPGRKRVSWRNLTRPATRTRFCEGERAGLWVRALNSPSHQAGLPDWNISTTTWEKLAALFHRAPATNRPRLTSTVFGLDLTESSTGQVRLRTPATPAPPGQPTPPPGMSPARLPPSRSPIPLSFRPIQPQTTS